MILFTSKQREQEEVLVKVIKYYVEHDDYSDIKCNFKGQISMPVMITNICLFEPRNKIILEKIEECFLEKRKILILSDRRDHLKYLKIMLDRNSKVASDII